jgi:tetratricopeptide (TPR) repeat protein
MAEATAAKRAVVRIYESHLYQQRNGEEPLSNQFKYELAQLYLDVGENDKALPLFEELREGAYSLVALAGLGTIAERRGNHQAALDYWMQMLKDTQVGDPLWFRGTYELAHLYHITGKTEQACRAISPAARMLPRLGNKRLTQQIQEQAVQSCGA